MKRGTEADEVARALMEVEISEKPKDRDTSEGVRMTPETTAVIETVQTKHDQNTVVEDHSNLHGIGYRPSSVFTKIEGHVQTIQDKKNKTFLNIPIGLFLHHISENPI